MIRKLLLTLGIVLAANLLVFSQAPGTLKGKVVDKETKDPIPFANIIIEAGGAQQGGATSDIDGNYIIKPIAPGKYTIRATYVGYNPVEVNGFVVGSGKTEFYNINMQASSTTLTGVEIVEYKKPLIEKDQTTVGASITSEQIAKMPNRSANAVAATVGGVFSSDGERGSVRGARSGATVTYIDGIKVTGSSSLPPSAIEEVNVIISGLPAMYGDATSGVINVVTKGPSREFGGGIELQTSQFLDKFGYNRVGLNLQGPLVMTGDSSNRKPLIGFFLAGDFLSQGDNSPSNIGRYKIKDDALASIKATPLIPTGTGFGTNQSASFLGKDMIEKVDNSTDATSKSANVSAKFDIKPSNSVNITIGGNLNYSDDVNYSFGNSLFNWENNGKVKELTYRVFGRFTHRFANDPESKSLFKNVYYSLQADYSRYKQDVQSQLHGDEVFKYGHVGKYDIYTLPSFARGSVTVDGTTYNNVYVQNGFKDTAVYFTPSSYNPDLARYTSIYYDYYPETTGNHQNLTQVQLGGGLLNGQVPSSIYNMWAAPGTPFGSYQKYELDQFGVNATFSADIGNHEIQFGLQYEQKKESYYGLNAISLWTHMRGITNFHIEQLDVNNPIMQMRDGVFTDTVVYNRKYDAASQRTFDRNLRAKLGLPVDGTDYINIDSYDFASKSISYYDANGAKKTVTLGEDILSLDLFSADDLLNSGQSYVNYYGYDHTGKKVSGNASFEDFFNAKNSSGDYIRALPAFEPNYIAGYIQDKFAYQDLLFNIGVRVDRFDANQMVLNDPYSLYPTIGAGQVTEIGGKTIDVPSNIPDDAVVYVDNVSTPTQVKGYRSGSTWYNAAGVEIQDPNLLNAGTGVNPLLKDPSNQVLVAESFKDYDPQWSVMPRISFSFPISEEALFFAHYDILTQRPTSSLRFNLTDYYYFNTQTGTINNPNLKPTKTIDYELGFKQKLSGSSVMTLSAYYKEMRDDIQIFRFNGAYPRDYTSYNNIDFGTVKGFTATYDLRQTNNVTLRASYTLQFADGTGSSTDQAASLIAAGLPNLRSTNPLAWDRRHAINISLDYRFSDGKEYNGPVIKREKSGKAPLQLLKNTGLNITVSGGSGTPYTRQSNITSAITGGTQLMQGSYYGSRLPWQFRVDARLDRDFFFKIGKRESSLNVYLQVLNVLGTENVMGVWSATGNANDDGYLAAAEWQRQIEEQLDPETFRTLYQIFVNRPGNYSSPRFIRLGAIFNL